MTVVEKFKTLAPIDNPSGGESVIRDFIATALRNFGVTEQVVDNAGNLLARVPGDDGKESILLSAHMDSVPPCHGIVPVSDESNGRPIIRSEGKTILGADDKSGIAVILDVVEQLSRQGFKTHHPLELLFSTQEEVGLKGAKEFDVKQLKSKYCYVLDGEGSVGEIFNAGPSQENIRLLFHGKRAHAGLCPEEGINAIQMAAAFCASVPGGRISPTLTNNWGLVEGGSAMNIVAPEAQIKGEARSHDEAELSALLKAYQQRCDVLKQQHPEGAVEMITERRYDLYKVPEEHPAVVNARVACEKLGVKPVVLPMNIGSDAHVLNHRGIPTVVLGMGFHYSHSLGEFLYQDELLQVVEWVKLLVNGKF